MTENGCRAFITVETSCAGKVNGLGGGYGARVSDSPSTDAVQEDNRRETALGIHAPRRRSMHLQDGFTNLRGTEEMPC